MERNTASFDWDGALTAGRTDYLGVRNAETTALRVAAARRFAALIGHFSAARDDGVAIAALERAAAGADPWRAEAAARVFSALDDATATARFIDFFIARANGAASGGGRPIDARHLRRLGRRRALPPELLDRVDPINNVYLIYPRFRRPSDAGRSLFDALLAEPDAFALTEAMNGIARWGEPALLRRALALPPVQPKSGPASPIEGSPRALWPRDVRPHAAFLLALIGEPDGLPALLGFAGAPDARVAADAVIRLGWLGHPDGVAPTAALLRARSNDAVTAALDAASSYGAAALAPALIDLVRRKVKTRNATTDDAINLLAQEIAGVALPDEIASAIGATGHQVDETGRRRAIGLLETAATSLDRVLRYRTGHPLTLADLADDLASRHDGRRVVAAYQLSAITGEHHDEDPDDDLIANLDAFDAWQARAAQPGPAPAGGWAFRGQTLSAPEVP